MADICRQQQTYKKWNSDVNCWKHTSILFTLWISCYASYHMLTISCWGLQCKVLKLHKLRWFPFLKTKQKKQNKAYWYFISIHPSFIYFLHPLILRRLQPVPLHTGRVISFFLTGQTHINKQAHLHPHRQERHARSTKEDFNLPVVTHPF